MRYAMLCGLLMNGFILHAERGEIKRFNYTL